MLTINCDMCKEDINEKAALLFSPPRGPLVLKFHLCKKCYKHIKDVIKEGRK